jgi:Fe-S cluster assembly iron-binding protein IscA
MAVTSTTAAAATSSDGSAADAAPPQSDEALGELHTPNGGAPGWLHSRLLARDTAALRAWLSRGGNPNTYFSCGTAEDPRRVSLPLFAWCMSGQPRDDETNDYSMLRALLESGADANFELSPGTRALKVGVENGACRLIELLLEFGADPNGLDPLSKADDTKVVSPLKAAVYISGHHSCSIQQSLRVMKLLIAYGARIDLPLLHSSIRHPFPEAFALFLKSSGIDPNTTSSDHVKPMLLAAAVREDDTIDIVRVLLRRGANIDVLAEDDYDSRLDGLAEADGPALKHLLLPVFWYPNTRRLLSEVLSAGSWKRYVREPCVDLLLLRILCQRGRASAPRGPLERLFSASFASSGAKRAARGASLPDSLFWVVLSYWRSSRQVGPPDHEADDDEIQDWMETRL